MTEKTLDQLIDIKYPDAVAFPLKGEAVAIIGPFSFDALAKVEDKFGALAEIGIKWQAGEISISDVVEIIFMLLENCDDFEDFDHFKKCVPVMAAERLMAVIFHFMKVSFPGLAEAAEGDDAEKPTDP